MVASVCVGMAERALELALDYARIREQFGKPIASFQMVQSKLAEIYIVSEVAPGESDRIEVTRTDFLKCGRCWRHLPEVAQDGGLCARCDGVVNG